MRRTADTWARLGILLVAVGLPSSCLLTSSFDGLTGSSAAPTTSSSSGSSGGQGGSGSVTTSTTSAGGAGGGASIPSTGVLDAFNRPEGPLGSSWLIDTPLNATVANHQLVMASGDTGVIHWPTAFGENQEVFITFKETHPDDFEIELLLKSQANVGECDALQLAYHPPMLMLFSCNSDGTGGGIGDSVTVTFEAGDQLAGRAFADGTVQAFKNSVLIGTWDASAWSGHTKAGRIGLGTYGLKTANRFDNFGGGTLP